MNKIILPKDVAEKFCENLNGGDLGGLEVLKEENLKKGFLDWDTECLLYTLIAMNSILCDYFWTHSLEDYETKPDFNEKWLLDLDDKYINSKMVLINKFSNVGFDNRTGMLKVIEG